MKTAFIGRRDPRPCGDLEISHDRVLRSGKMPDMFDARHRDHVAVGVGERE
jgi:hypothetical protein